MKLCTQGTHLNTIIPFHCYLYREIRRRSQNVVSRSEASKTPVPWLCVGVYHAITRSNLGPGHYRHAVVAVAALIDERRFLELHRIHSISFRRLVLLRGHSPSCHICSNSLVHSRRLIIGRQT